MSRSGMQPEARGYAVNAAPSVGLQLGFESGANRCVSEEEDFGRSRIRLTH